MRVLLTPSVRRLRAALERPPQKAPPVVYMPEGHVALDGRWPDLPTEERTKVLLQAVERWSDWLQFPGAVLVVTSLGEWPLRDPVAPARPPADA